jgi:hypothetical protein
MLLKFINFSPLPSYEDLCKDLSLSSQALPLGETLSSEEMLKLNIKFAAEVTKYIVRNDLNFRNIFREEDWEKALETAPIMVAMAGGRRFWGNLGHMIVLTQFKEGVFTYLDPWFSAATKRHIKTISKDKFYKYYGSFAFQLLPSF